jgi:hypothetical protein
VALTVPAPGEELAAKATVVTPEGFKFAKVSLAVKVEVTEVPEAKVREETLKSDCASEKGPGTMFIKFEQSVVSVPELARR